MNLDLEPLRIWLHSTGISWIMTHTKWAWAASETLHFMGLTLLIGTVGLFDLRLLGLAKGVSPAALHRLIPWGIGGFIVNVLTGFCFLAGTPDQYLYNNAFRLKVVFLFLAGINVLVFYSAVFRRVRILGPGANTPLAAKIIACTSLALWIGVISCGRMLTFFRPLPGTHH